MIIYYKLTELLRCWCLGKAEEIRNVERLQIELGPCHDVSE